MKQPLEPPRRLESTLKTLKRAALAIIRATPKRLVFGRMHTEI
jgi:hypothetical protein